MQHPATGGMYHHDDVMVPQRCANRVRGARVVRNFRAVSSDHWPVVSSIDAARCWKKKSKLKKAVFVPFQLREDPKMLSHST